MPDTHSCLYGRHPGEDLDRRRHKRVDLRIRGRFLDQDSEDHPLVTTDVSCSGALIRSVARPPPKAIIVCYFDDLGRVAGTVVRRTYDGFAVRFNVAGHKRDKLADRLVWLLNKDSLGLNDDRDEKRHNADGNANVTLPCGQVLSCRVLDISLSGANFECVGHMPLVGDIVTAGNIVGEVVRSNRRGFAIRFLTKDERLAL